MNKDSIQVKAQNLTQEEIPRLPESFNLTDGHIHRDWDKSEKAIVSRVSEIFKFVNREKQYEIEKEFINVFFDVAHQTVTNSKCLLCSSASMSLEIIANHLRLNKLSLALIEPCFDNLADIFKRHEIDLEPIPDEVLNSKDFQKFLNRLKSDTICIVNPNNPTGKIISEENFRKLIDYCKENNKLLILDASFRFYTSENKMFDQYKLLGESGIDYLVVEDTGKTYPTHDLKVSILAMNQNLYLPIYKIYTDFILYLSPFIVKLLTEFIKNSHKNNLNTIREVVRKNKLELRKNINGTILQPVDTDFSSVAWLEVIGMSSLELKKILDEKGVFILPGTYFYWSNPKKGDNYIRVALTREPSVFSEAVNKIKETIRGFNDTQNKPERERFVAVSKSLRQNKKPVVRTTLNKNYIVLDKVFDPAYLDSLLLAEAINNLDVDLKDVLDVGTGCGIHAIFAAPKANNVDAIDISQTAIENALLNISLHDLQNKVRVIKSDLFSNVTKKYDLIIANLPFYSQKPRDVLEKSITSYKNNVLRRFFKDVKTHLNENGKVLMVFSDVGNIKLFHNLAKETFSKIKTLAQKKDGNDNYFVYLMRT